MTHGKHCPWSELWSNSGHLIQTTEQVTSTSDESIYAHHNVTGGRWGLHRPETCLWLDDPIQLSQSGASSDNWCIQLTRLHYWLHSSSPRMQLAGVGFGGETARGLSSDYIIIGWRLKSWKPRHGRWTSQFGENCHQLLYNQVGRMKRRLNPKFQIL